MKKMDIKQLFKLKQNEMLATFGLGEGFTHPGTKGDATETEWRSWFNKFFPKRYHAEKAFVIDHQGNCSQQMDIVIYDTHFSPTIFEYNEQKYIPAESVYAVFEVKQELNKEYILYAQEKIKSVKDLIRTSAPINTIYGYTDGRKAPTIIGGLLSLRSVWKPENIEENIKKIVSENTKDLNEQIDFICCLSTYACGLEHSPECSTFHDKKIYMPNFNLITDAENSPLIFTYFKLLRMLQDMGNAPAIEYSKYGISGIDPKSNR